MKRLDYVYPYEQAVGFLMQRAGYSEAQYRTLKARVGEFKFFLTHAMKDPAYDAAWRLFYPKDL